MTIWFGKPTIEQRVNQKYKQICITYGRQYGDNGKTKWMYPQHIQGAGLLISNLNKLGREGGNRGKRCREITAEKYVQTQGRLPKVSFVFCVTPFVSASTVTKHVETKSFGGRKNTVRTARKTTMNTTRLFPR